MQPNMKYTLNLIMETDKATMAQVTGQLLQNIVDNTDDETKLFLHREVTKNPAYFRKISQKLKNPILKTFFK